MTKTIMLSIICLLGIFCLRAETPTVDIKVAVNHISESKGQLLIAIYDKEEGAFEDSHQVVSKIVAAQAGTMTFSFSLPTGQYAIGVIHDKNSNGQLDTNFLGIPTEDYGFSNSAIRPNFQRAKINITHPQTISIDLQ